MFYRESRQINVKNPEQIYDSSIKLSWPTIQLSCDTNILLWVAPLRKYCGFFITPSWNGDYNIQTSNAGWKFSIQSGSKHQAFIESFVGTNIFFDLPLRIIGHFVRVTQRPLNTMKSQNRKATRKGAADRESLLTSSYKRVWQTIDTYDVTNLSIWHRCFQCCNSLVRNNNIFASWSKSRPVL